MKKLSQYILENRKLLGDIEYIPFEKLDRIFMDISSGNESNDPNLYKGLPEGTYNLLLSYYYSSKGMNGMYSRDGVERFRRLIHKQPISRIKKLLGAGSEGMTIEMGDGDKVMKVLFDTDFISSNDRQLRLFKGMVGKSFKTLPKIYKVTSNKIVREKVDVGTKKCEKYYELSKKKVNGISIERLICTGVSRGDLNGIGDEYIIDWLFDLRRELLEVGVIDTKDKNFGDFKPSNLGETKDGRVVYFDF